MKPDLKSKFTVKNRLASFRYAIKGIYHLFRYEHNAWIQAIAAFIIITLGFILHFSKTEWALIIICIGLVLMAEILNTAMELLVDLVSPEYNELAGKIKDLSAGAVLISSIVSLIVGLIVIIPKLLILCRY